MWHFSREWCSRREVRKVRVFSDTKNLPSSKNGEWTWRSLSCMNNRTNVPKNILFCFSGRSRMWIATSRWFASRWATVVRWGTCQITGFPKSDTICPWSRLWSSPQRRIRRYNFVLGNRDENTPVTGFCFYNQHRQWHKSIIEYFIDLCHFASKYSQSDAFQADHTKSKGDAVDGVETDASSDLATK